VADAVIAEFYPDDLIPGIPDAMVEVAPGIEASRHLHTPESLRQLALGLRARARHFRDVPADEVLDGLATIHAQWADTASEERAEAVRLIQAATGYPHAIIDDSLRRLFAGMTRAALEGWLRSGGVELAALDGPGPGSQAGMWVHGPRLTAVVSSGNVPGAALPSVVQALLLKSPCLVKTAAAEPFLLPLYVRSLARSFPELTAALAVTHWEGGSAELEQALLREVEALVVYGSDTTLTSLRARLPIRARFLGYGHRISFSAIGRELLGDVASAREAARRAAYDLCVFDQQGCYSPQTLFVETGGALSPEAFAELLADALEQFAQPLPRRSISATEAAEIHQYRARMEMRSFSDPAICLWASEAGTGWTVALVSADGLEPCVLNRTAVVRPVADLSELLALLEGREPYLLSAVLGVAPERLGTIVGELARAGVSRITHLGSAQLPASPLFHDGVSAIAQFARFVTVEGNT
jgi:hypothetical protein